MNTKYYRFLYYPVYNGLLFGASIDATSGKDGTQILYLSSTDNSNNRGVDPSFESEHIHCMIMGDVLAQTVGRAQKIMDTNQVDMLFVPAANDAQPIAQGATELRTVENTMEVSLPGFVLKLFCNGERLIAYMGGTGRTPDAWECVMNVKPHTPAHACRLAVDAGNLSCEMKCLLNQDVTYCKKQNQKNEKYFVDGHLLLGTADIACLPKLRDYLAEDWEKIRFIGLPKGGSEEGWDDALLTAGTDGHRRYFIGTAESSPKVVKTVSAHDAYSSFALTGADAGLCISGCYAER